MPHLNALPNDRVKKASYYVWFLGASECRGLRGSDVVSSVLGKLLGRERSEEPQKVTLQVSSKGIKLLQLLQDGLNLGIGGLDGGGRAAKHLIPAGALTYVQQESPPNDDLVTAVLLIYNPVTRCPVHLHAYRCDSSDTATILRDHLEQLVNKPQQQAKLSALESRLASRGLLPRNRSSAVFGPSSNTNLSNGASLAALYDSLANELKEKLGGAGNSAGPLLLLPPRDYHSNRHEDDSARSSGIGSDDAPPSPLLDSSHHRSPLNRQPSSSDDEWACDDVRPEINGLSWKNSPPSGGGGGGGGLLGGLNGNRGSNHRLRSPSPLTRASKARPEVYKEPHKNSSRNLAHKESFRDSLTYGKLEREGYNDKDLCGRPDREESCGKDCYRSNSRQASRRMTSPSRNLSPVRIGVTRKVPPSLKHSSAYQPTRDRSESPVSQRERFHDARDKFLSLEREWRRNGDMRGSTIPIADTAVAASRRSKGNICRRRDNREELGWPKTDRDTGYGSRDGLLRDKRAGGRDYDRGYGTCDTRDSEHWLRELERRSPDYWDVKGAPERSLSPSHRYENKNYRFLRNRSPDRIDHQRSEYQRAKSMHDLSRNRSAVEDDVKGDLRRRSLYDALDNNSHLQKSRSQQHQGLQYHSYGNLGPVRSSTPSSCSSAGQSGQGYEIPESQRYPGLDRATARPDPLLAPRYAGFSKRTFDYPVNGGQAPIHISRAHHDDYRRFRYDHNHGQFTRSTTISGVPY
ncbi:uncharacterized protein LOC108667307 [Hyalella azteca]|uniref:Uncharacterized protein LOC108667307 n=1 Tax=Hyalella azteca TaxID=294128 RepID=A0A8B7N7E2_HYAAZ|nr:uncharacterized protein LOC108667307 [Hyalella azteca]